MTTSLKKAIEGLNKLPSTEQNANAELIVEELTWKTSFEDSQDFLATLASKAEAEYKGKRTLRLQSSSSLGSRYI